jgi:hypothetical protein
MLIFVYGSLLDPVTLRRKSGEQRVRLVPARISGWHRHWRDRYPTLRRGGVVEGALVRVSARGFGRLCAYEGPAYRLCSQPIRVGGRIVRGFCWLK